MSTKVKYPVLFRKSSSSMELVSVVAFEVNIILGQSQETRISEAAGVVEDPVGEIYDALLVLAHSDRRHSPRRRIVVERLEQNLRVVGAWAHPAAKKMYFGFSYLFSYL